jgi:hypothetical protein
MRTTRLRVTLREVESPVVRVIDVPATSTLAELHDLMQVAIGWTNSHLHQFVAGEIRYGVPSEDSWDDEERDEATAGLKDLPDTFVYLYDFGDGWEHEVEVLGSGDEQPGCRYGQGACPPEDCGGPGGYERLLAVLADPKHEDHERLSAWAGELARFDQHSTDALVRLTVGEVPESVRIVLDIARTGIKLTPTGRLPRALVREVQLARPHWGFTERPASSEYDLPALAFLHDLLRRVGLLRLTNGVLRPTRSAANDLHMLRRLRSWFEPQDFATILAGDVVAALVAFGAQRNDQLAARILPSFDWGWAGGGQPMTEVDLRLEILSLSSVLQSLDQVEIDAALWRPGP